MPKRLTNNEFLQKLKDNNVEYIPLEEYKGFRTKIKFMCNKNSEHTFYAEPCNIYKGYHRCPYCSHRKVFVGETDIWTTNPEIASMLLNPEDGYKYLKTSSQKVDWVCPNCNHIVKDKIINNVTKQGLACPYCSDSMSFSEKFVSNLLKQLSVTFFHDRTISWSDNKRYDFYIPSLNLIIETNGIQHYDRGFEFKNSKRKQRSIYDEKQNDIYKKNLALKNGIKYYIILDCKKSDLDYIKNSILNSKLKDIFDLSIVDWDKCYSATITSNIVLVSDLWNGGMKNTKEISEYTGIHICSVIAYLKQSAKIDLSDFQLHYKKNRNRYKKVMCIETGKIYECIQDVTKDGYSGSHISNCCYNKCETAYGLHWQFI